MDSTIKVLITSDLHLGYAENDPIRGSDSFNTFEEILAKANEHQVMACSRGMSPFTGQPRVLARPRDGIRRRIASVCLAKSACMAGRA
jgi:hypothetical protein